jgi:hypothetical protein
MTWPEFLTLYVLASAAVALVNRKLYRARVFRVAQTCLLLTSVCFLLDYPAETRQLWRFPNTTGIRLYETPVENHIFNFTCFFNLLSVYLSLKNRHADTTRETAATTR